MKRAQEASKGEVSLARNFEQLVELGKQRQARRQRPATSSTSSTGCGNTRSSSAPPTSTSSRGATSAPVRFRIDGVLHQVYAIPHAGADRDDVARSSCSRAWTSSRSAARRTAASRRVTPDGDEVELRISTHADRVRREGRDAHLRRPRCWSRDFAELGLHRRRPRALGAA